MRRSFVVWFCGALCAFAVLLAALSVWIETLGEAAPDVVIARQMRSANTILFASGIEGDFFRYKIALLDRLRSRIVVLGSSRAMQVRREFFIEDLANLGGAVRSLTGLELAVDELLRAPRRPDLLILFADIWWFNSVAHPENLPDTRPWRRFDPGHVYQAGRVLIGNAEKVSTLIPPPPDRLGLLGIMGNQGFDQYGSFFYISMVTGRGLVDDYRFNRTQRRVRYGVESFEHASEADVAAVERFVRAVQRLQTSGTHVVLVFPPFAGSTNDLMAEMGGYGYVADLFRQLSDRGLHPLDYHDLRVQQRGVANPDCEFIDGFHGGDVAYARLLRDAAERDTELRSVVDLTTLDAFIDVNSGYTHGVRRFFRDAEEVDFLGLGCERLRPN